MSGCESRSDAKRERDGAKHKVSGAAIKAKTNMNPINKPSAMALLCEATPVVILAGGKGTRLLPYTTALPKPLMPVGEYPILEIILRQLANQGFRNITLAVGHLAGLIQAYFKDGKAWGIEITYAQETTPLGTAGPIARLPKSERSTLVLNAIC